MLRATQGYSPVSAPHRHPPDRFFRRSRCSPAKGFAKGLGVKARCELPLPLAGFHAKGLHGPAAPSADAPYGAAADPHPAAAAVAAAGGPAPSATPSACSDGAGRRPPPADPPGLRVSGATRAWGALSAAALVVAGAVGAGPSVVADGGADGASGSGLGGGAVPVALQVFLLCGTVGGMSLGKDIERCVRVPL